ncbi:MAG TPA: MFS transporter [Spirochaetales bacterium]|nr:MFS transporter [Spirochaetales bacterium]
MDTADKKILTMVALGHTLVHLIEGILPPLIPVLLLVFKTDYFHLGLVMTVFSYAFGLGAFPAGVLADKVGSKKLLLLYLFGAGILCLAVFLVQSLIPFAVLMGFLGILGSLYHPAANTLISLGIKERGKGFGINGIAGSLGTSIVPFLAAFLASIWGWRFPFLVFGMGVLLLGVFATFVPAPQAIPGKPQENEKAGAASAGIVSDPEPATASRKALVLFYLSCALAGMGNRGVLTFLPTYLGKRISLESLGIDSVRLGGIFATLTLIAGAAGQYIAGTLVDRHRPQKLYILALAISTGSILLMGVSRGILLFLGAVGFGFFSFSYQPMQNTLVSKLLPRHRRGMGYGFMFFMTFGIGSLAAAFSGWLADRFGLNSVFLAMSVCYAGACLTMYGMERYTLAASR